MYVNKLLNCKYMNCMILLMSDMVIYLQKNWDSLDESQYHYML
jgi:hypothetical protein